MADEPGAAAAAATSADAAGSGDPQAGGAESLPPPGCGLPVAEGGGVLSPLSGAYLLIILSEPMSDQHKTRMVQKLRQGERRFIYHHTTLATTMVFLSPFKVNF